MSDIFRKIQSGISIRTLSTSPAPSVQGDFNVDTSSGDIQYHNGTALAHVTTNSNTLTLTNKTLDATLNTLSNIANANIAASAAIAYSKLALTGSILNADLAGSIAYSKLVLTGSILNADLAGSIAYSKLVLSASIQNSDLATMPTHTIKGNITSGTAAPVDLTYSQVNTALATITGLSGDVSATGAGGTATATVNSVGGSTAANVHAAELLANAATASATASTIIKRDANGNTQVNNLLEGLTNNFGVTTTLVAASTYSQNFGGPSISACVLPDATTLTANASFLLTNQSSNALTVKTNGGATLLTIPVSYSACVTCLGIGTSAGTWNVAFYPNQSPTTTPVLRAIDTLTSVPTNTSTVVKFDSVQIDTNSSWNTTTGTYTVKNPGYYKIDCNISFGSISGTFPSSNSQNIINLYVNGTLYVNSANSAIAGNSQCLVVFNDIVSASVNDTFQIKVQCPNTAPSMFNPRLMITQVPSVFYT